MEDLKKRKMEEMGNNDQLSTQEELRSLLDPLAKSQLVDLLSRLGSQYPSIAEEIKSIASSDPVHRKLFVRGLAWNTTSETLCAAFRMHGEIEEGAVIYDKATGKSRGYGFITYKHMESAHSALRAPSKLIDVSNSYFSVYTHLSSSHLFLFLFSLDETYMPTQSFSPFGLCYSPLSLFSKIRVALMAMASGVNISPVKLNTEREKRRRKTHSGSISDNQKMTLRGGPPAGRMAVCNLACEGLTGASTTPDLAQRKLYIGGLSPDVTSEMLLNYFGRHGEIEEGSVAYDKDTNESRGFGFVTYKTTEAAKKAIDDPQKILGGRTIIVKLADTHKGKPVQTQVPAAAVVPLAMPMAPGYPQLGKAHPSAAPAGYAYPQPVAPYQASSYSSPAAAPTPYPSQSTIAYASIAAKKDPQGIPPTTPMGMSGYPYYIGKQ
ncbi:hypothetical protein Goshw_007941 [Gossypium schwendimanii]|uniref:RRM domain-containing protein n=1 Tax=Gossypium schwendimanii TaxID=34291 RepID=A0A7J9LEL5_GOSSC|nr:hypothetical protein [Gossypium schwendimanii]